MPIRLLIVDDSEFVRKGLRNILRAKPDWEVCGEASDGLDAIAMFKSLSPDVTIMDFQMPGVNGLDAAAKILQIDPMAKIVLFTQHASPALEKHALDVGIRIVVSKTDTSKMVGQIAALLVPKSPEP
jgi:two-component system, NarL family, invasion response regulator UvrY